MWQWWRVSKTAKNLELFRRNLITLCLFWLSCHVLSCSCLFISILRPGGTAWPIFTDFHALWLTQRVSAQGWSFSGTGKYVPKTLQKWLPKWNKIWLPAVILKNRYDAITPPTIITLPLIVRLLRMQNDMPMPLHPSKSKPEIEF